MAFNDIWIDTNSMGGHERIMEGHMTAGQTFFKGEPVNLVAAGTWTESVSDPSIIQIGGIAMTGPGDGVAPYAGLAQNWETGTTAVGGFGATGLKVKVLIPTPTTFFLTQNFSITTVFNDSPPTVAMIGDNVALLRTPDTEANGVWGIRQAGGTDLIATITDILDVNLKSYRLRTDVPTITLGANGKPTYWVQFLIATHQFSR